jgi:hypothetical protein
MFRHVRQAESTVFFKIYALDVSTFEAKTKQIFIGKYKIIRLQNLRLSENIKNPKYLNPSTNRYKRL